MNHIVGASTVKAMLVDIAKFIEKSLLFQIVANFAILIGIKIIM